MIVRIEVLKAQEFNIVIKENKNNFIKFYVTQISVNYIKKIVVMTKFRFLIKIYYFKKKFNIIIFVVVTK